MERTMKIGSFAWRIAPALTWSLFTLFAPAAAAVELQSLERGLVQQSPALIEHFKANGSKNVGVLKFLVAREGGKGFSDSVGTLNMLLARRLEVALVLVNDPKTPVGVIRNASAVAARTKGANHLTLPGRKRLFEPDYPLAWGKDEVKADAFVTGTALISKDLSKLTVSLFSLDRGKDKLEPLGKAFEVRNDSGKLAEMNESFVVRGGAEDGQAVAAAASVKGNKVRHPLATNGSPVSLEILYDNEPVRIEYRDGKAFAPEPREEQTVAFRMRRDGLKARYGVVLKVNGENTIAKQRQPDLHCRRWILDPGSGPITVDGYQLDDKTLEKFHVLSRAASKAREMDYGKDVGTVSVTVFREQGKEDLGDAGEEKAARNARLVAKVVLPTKGTYDALKKELLEEANESEVRGLVVPGARVTSAVKTVEFNPAPTPVMSATIIYYRP
jgi:hypothetical protein